MFTLKGSLYLQGEIEALHEKLSNTVFFLKKINYSSKKIINYFCYAFNLESMNSSSRGLATFPTSLVLGFINAGFVRKFLQEKLQETSSEVVI